MARVSNKTVNCALYLYPTKAAALQGKKIGASGFLVVYPSTRVPGRGHYYAVTNRHVYANAPVIRLNTADGKLDPIITDPIDWEFLEDDDIAVHELNLTHDAYIKAAASTKWFIESREKLLAKGIGPGDETFIVGRFIKHDGTQQNRPSVRFGMLSVLADPNEKVKNYHLGISVEAFLVESHTIGGYSGSPVFVHIPTSGAEGIFKGADAPPGEVSYGARRPLMRGPWLLGVDWGHILHYDPVLEKNEAGQAAIETEFMTQTTTGMMCVSPAWKLQELLDKPRLAAKRFAMETKWLSEMTEKTTALDSVDEIVSRDEILRRSISGRHHQKPKAKRAKRGRAAVNNK